MCKGKSTNFFFLQKYNQLWYLKGNFILGLGKGDLVDPFFIWGLGTLFLPNSSGVTSASLRWRGPEVWVECLLAISLMFI